MLDERIENSGTIAGPITLSTGATRIENSGTITTDPGVIAISSTGDSLDVENSGTILGGSFDDADGGAFHLNSGVKYTGEGDVTVVNHEGAIIGGDRFGFEVNNGSAPAPDSVTVVDNDGLLAGGEDGFRATNTNLTFTNRGTVDGTGEWAFAAGADGISTTANNFLGQDISNVMATIINEEAGSLTGIRAGIVNSMPTLIIDNTGLIEGGGSGILSTFSFANIHATFDLKNTGTIRHSGEQETPTLPRAEDAAGVVVLSQSSTNDVTIENEGLIEGANHGVFASGGIDLLFNDADGIIRGDSDGDGNGVAIRGEAEGDQFTSNADFIDFADHIVNEGTIEGGMILGLGNDTVLNEGVISGSVILGAGRDTLTSSGDNALDVFGGKGDDRITSGDGNDTLTGGDGNDILKGNGGDDLINGGNRYDLVSGGAGADTLDGGAGRDTLLYKTSDAGVTVNLATGSAAGGHAEGDQVSGFENIRGSTHDDSLTGDSGANRLGGSHGNDTLDGGAGNDTLVGGSGEDVFVFGTGTGDDTVLDFNVSSDTLDLSQTTTDFTSAADVEAVAEDTADGLLIDLGGGDSVLLSGVSVSDIADMLFGF